MEAQLLPKVKPSDRHWYAYDVRVDGDLIISDSRDPEHDLARALLARGITGVVTLIDGKTGKPRTRVNIEKAAKWCVVRALERYRWKGEQRSDSSPQTGKREAA